MLKRRNSEARIVHQMSVEMSIRLQDSVRAKERLQFYTSAISFTSAVLLSDEGVRKNSKVRKRHDFSHFSGN